MSYLVSNGYNSKDLFSDKLLSEDFAEDAIEDAINQLRKTGLIKTMKNSRYGYCLNCDPKLLTLGDIIHSLEDNRDFNLFDNEYFIGPSQEFINNVCSNLNGVIKKLLNEVRLKDILYEEKEKICKSEHVIYADHNSTSSVASEIKNQLMNFIENDFHNPSSVHKLGQKARKIVEDTRELLCESLNAKGYNVIFTSSGTEANNLVIKGTKNCLHMASTIEHLSILNCVSNDNLISVDKNGIINFDHLVEMLELNKEKKILISVALSNNETGVIQPIKEIVSTARKYGAVIHTDAIQACGKIILDLKNLGVDMMTVSAHKFGGLTGAAALIFNSEKVKITPMLKGGSQERGFRAGTENVASIYGMHLALKNISNYKAKMQKCMKLRDDMENEILSLVPEAFIFSKKAERIPNTSCIYMPNVSNELQVMYFDMNNIAISSGSACSSGKVEISHVLLAMGVNKNYARNSIRISLGPDSTKKEVNKIIKCWYSVYNNFNRRNMI